MKVLKLILVLFSIISNEIVAEIVLSDEIRITLLDSSSQEAENETSELEGEFEIDFSSEFVNNIKYDSQDFQSSIERNLANITDPLREIHSPPPE